MSTVLRLQVFRRADVAFAIGVILILLITSVFVTRYYLQDSGIPDVVGYRQATYQLARGEGLDYASSQASLTPTYNTLMAFKTRRPGHLRPSFSFPPGLPLLLAPVALLSDAPAAIHIGMGMLGLVALLSVALILRQLTTPLLALLGTVMVAGTPLWLEHATAYWSEIPSAAVIYGGCALYGWQHSRPGRWSTIVCSVAGILVGYSVLIRTANLFLVPAFVLIPWGYATANCVDRGSRWAFWTGLASTILGVLLFHQFYFGGPLRTGYTPGANGGYSFPLFSLTYLLNPQRSGYHLLVTLWDNLGWLLVLLVPAFATRAWRRQLPWLTLIAGTFIPYAVYFFPATGVNGRFILISLPALCALLVQGAEALRPRIRHRAIRGTGMIVLVVLALWRVPATMHHLETRNRSNQATLEMIMGVAQTMPPNAVVISYLVNDVMSVYGQRAVLNYRTMPMYDPQTRKYNYGVVATTLTESVQALLDAEIPVYYVRDQTPPLYNSEAILEATFTLEPVPAALPLFRVVARP